MTTRAHRTSAVMIRALSAAGCAALLFLFLTVAANVASAETVTDDNVAELTTTAKTAADHEALASYYEAKAEEASGKVELHKKMLARMSSSGGKPYTQMKPHCQRLIKAYQEAAEDYEALAKFQTELAKEAKK